MITEIAQIDVKPGTEAEFETAVTTAKALFKRARGFHGLELHRSIENPQRYRLMVQWATLENHTVDFRGSENFTQWRALVGSFFATPPEVEHTNTVVKAGRGNLAPKVSKKAAKKEAKKGAAKAGKKADKKKAAK